MAAMNKTGWEGCDFQPDERVRIGDTFPNIRWAGMYGHAEAFDAQHGNRYYITLEEGGHRVWVEGQHLASAPTAEELERRAQQREEQRLATLRQVTADEWNAATNPPSLFEVGQRVRATQMIQIAGGLVPEGTEGVIVEVDAHDAVSPYKVAWDSLRGHYRPNRWAQADEVALVIGPMTGTVTGRFSSASGAPVSTPYTQKTGDVLIVGDNDQPLGCVDAQVPLGECRVKVIINGQERWYRMVEAVSREAEAEAAKVGVFSPGRKLKL